ncbi:hypothetical protein PTNB73_08640 [Pyrenophora teres f. teres]|uniref:Kelch-5 domain containing protein n=1 Tax=Pyrenophora teres f. teres TaxID=97479 RepID=A0A6S6WH85_9PLEO|nr:hypothetical protein HRS9139_08753 [Pyrenophora teres f. teres]KAE8834740.1 hypothetical protein PTNB85_06073 [Pyrenophora teres f. teres]KAE8843782.1 hypothetical protein HRS9122_04885 [Pyrenophora teres f. teres]KAE8859160.1 hypothetical protein PTNB73_08640 [Pyrenophora teres f. teres]KAE8861026.1 hypothetical protein PTNB29_06121 [Pyrenophora teres f. teres]
MPPRVLATHLLIFSAFCGLVIADQIIHDPIKDFCRRHQHQTCVIDSKVYVDGGLVYYGTGVNLDSQPETNDRLVYGDLASISEGAPVLYGNLSKGSKVPSVSGGVLWPDQVNKIFYLFGGEYNNGSVNSFSDGLWYYDTISNIWSQAPFDGSQTKISWPAFGGSAVTEEGIAWYYGGYLNNKTVPNWDGAPLMLNSLVSYDMTKRTWTNNTEGIARAEGTLQYIPAGSRGMLIYFGGRETSASGNVSYQIQIYDIANSRWYTQTATAGIDDDIPRKRRGFCANTVWAKDHSSYNIYMFGGIASDETALGDIYILSLPSFTWIPYPYSQPKQWFGGKAWASCALVKNSQMIVTSGFYTNSTKTGCDVPTIGGQHTLFLGQESIEQGTVYHALAADVVKYRVPGNVTAVIGGDTDGKATLKSPTSGWATSALAVGFGTTYAGLARTATRSLPASSSTPTSSGLSASTVSSYKSSSNVGAIAGGAVGGAVVFIAIIALALHLRSRRKRAKLTPTTITTNTAHTSTAQDNRFSTAGEKHFSMSQGSTMYSPHPQGSPRPPSELHGYGTGQQHHSSGSEWIQPLPFAHDYETQQTYYPSPRDPLHSPSSPHSNSAELPIVNTPGPSELSAVRSPQPTRGNV